MIFSLPSARKDPRSRVPIALTWLHSSNLVSGRNTVLPLPTGALQALDLEREVKRRLALKVSRFPNPLNPFQTILRPVINHGAPNRDLIQAPLSIPLPPRTHQYNNQNSLTTRFDTNGISRFLQRRLVLQSSSLHSGRLFYCTDSFITLR